MIILEVPEDFNLEEGIHKTPPSQKVAQWSELMTSYLKQMKMELKIILKQQN